MPAEPLPYSPLSSRLAVNGMFLVQQAGAIIALGRSSPNLNADIRRWLAEIEAAVQAYERTAPMVHVGIDLGREEPQPHVRPPLSVVKP